MAGSRFGGQPYHVGSDVPVRFCPVFNTLLHLDAR
jgi:hypothetical protein